MQITIDLGYDQVFELAMQLSPEEMERLARELDTRKLITEYPVPTEEDLEEKRRTLLQLAMECPVATEEEVQEIEKNMKNFRREFNESFERRLD